MRLATLILPTHDNEGVDQTASHLAMRLSLIDHFGGFTMTAAHGGWRDDATGRVYCEPVAVYSIAMDVTQENARKLESIARLYGHMTGQICVMVTHADGSAVFVDSSANILEKV